MAENYFNALPLRLQLEELGQCRFMESDEFNGVEALRGKKIVIVGCGAQGLNQGLNLRDSGLDVSYTLRDSAIQEKRQSWKNATEQGFTVGSYEELLPTADLVINLTPDKHRENDPQGLGLEIAKAYACGTGGDRAGVLQSSFVAEVKSDLMGEQTILCGLLQTGSLLCYNKMIDK